MNEFLKTEYEQCLDLVKFYDERHQSLVKYATGLSTAVPSFLLAVSQAQGEIAKSFYSLSALISGIAVLGLISLFIVLTQTRLYFVYPVRQVNAIRKVSLEDVSDKNFENQMYLSTNFNAFKWKSSHALLHMFIALQIGALASLCTYSALMRSENTECVLFTSIVAGGILAVLCFSLSSVYLHKSSKYRPDSSIHNDQGGK